MGEQHQYDRDIVAENHINELEKGDKNFFKKLVNSDCSGKFLIKGVENEANVGCFGSKNEGKKGLWTLLFHAKNKEDLFLKEAVLHSWDMEQLAGRVGYPKVQGGLFWVDLFMKELQPNVPAKDQRKWVTADD